ncbi:MAG: hypothetical protein QOE36_1875 [Gaiellaceae bacterium]|jgi:hypothetical protein|nr:hypothetical protein [Gaiellaceae bacterium]
MIGVALALVVLGIIGLFVFPWVGAPVALVGIILVIVFLAGFGKHAKEERV